MTSINVQAAFQKFERERVRVPQDGIGAAKLVHPQIAGFYEQALKVEPEFEEF